MHEFDDLPGLLHGIRHGLFHEYMLALEQGGPAYREMVRGGGDDIHRIHGIQQCLLIREPGDPVFGGHFSGHGVIRIDESDDLHTVDLLPVVEVEFAQMSRAENAQSDHGAK